MTVTDAMALKWGVVLYRDAVKAESVTLGESQGSLLPAG